MATATVVREFPKCQLMPEAHLEERVARYDGKMLLGPWAYMCERCWQKHGVGKLGTGLGQKLMWTQETFARELHLYGPDWPNEIVEQMYQEYLRDEDEFFHPSEEGV